MPSIATVAPISLVAGSDAQTLTLTGSGFVPSTVVSFNGLALATSYLSATSLSASVPAASIAADGVASIVVTNPPPGGGPSSALQYRITVPTPVLTSLSPQSVAQGTAVTITITGTGFEANSFALWLRARPTTYVNSTTLKVALTAADLQNPGTASITVVNPAIEPAAPLQLTILPIPVLAAVSPTSLPVSPGSNVPVQVTLRGTAFASNSTVQANGTSVPTVEIQPGGTDPHIVVALSPSYLATPGQISFVVTNPGPPALSSNQVVLRVLPPSIGLYPMNAPVGSPDITLGIGGNFFPDSVVLWNGTPIASTYVSSTQLTAVIPASWLSGFVHASIRVISPENQIQPDPQSFDTYLPVPVNDIVYNTRDGLIYASVSDISPNGGYANSVIGIDPISAAIRNAIFVGSNPNRLALSSDGTQLFVGLDGISGMCQVDLTTGHVGAPFSLPRYYDRDHPYQAVSLAGVPGQPNSVAVFAFNPSAIYGSSPYVAIFDAGVARPDYASLPPTIALYYPGALTFGDDASTLYAADNGSSPAFKGSPALNGYLYRVYVGSTGAGSGIEDRINTNTDGPSVADMLAFQGSFRIQYDNGLLYLPTARVFSAATGAQVGQFSTLDPRSGSIVPAKGPIVSDSALHRAWVLAATSPGIVAYDEKSYEPIATVPLDTATILFNGLPRSGNMRYWTADLIRWGQDGLAFHTPNALFVLRGSFVNDLSSSAPADLSMTAQAPASAGTGAPLTYTITASNLGPAAARSVTVAAGLPPSVIFNSASTSKGSCNGTATVQCELGTLAGGETTSITVSVTPTLAATLQMNAAVSSLTFDPVAVNNQAVVSTAVTGIAYNPVPTLVQLSPNIAAAGSGSITLTVNGTGFRDSSVVQWNGAALPSAFVNSGQLTATVDASLLKDLGWAQVSVASPAPGGGQSNALTFNIPQWIDVPASAIAYDPYSRLLYAVLPSTAATMAGNSLVAIEPATGSVGTPHFVGSDPNLLAETTDGNYLYIGLSGDKALGRFNLLTQTLESTIPLPANSSTGLYEAAQSMAAVPGSDKALAVGLQESGMGSYSRIGILDISGAAASFRPSSVLDDGTPAFADATHLYIPDSGGLCRNAVDDTGVHRIDCTALKGMGTATLDGGLIFGSGGAIVDPTTTPPSQMAAIQVGPTPWGDAGSTGLVPYAAESKSFLVAVLNSPSPPKFLERFDTRKFTLDDGIQLPIADDWPDPRLLTSKALTGTRWGQDGLAYLLSGYSDGSGVHPAQIFLMRGPFILPAEGVANSAPSLTSTDHDTISAGSGNLMISVTGRGFLPGATVFWNGSARTTTFVNTSNLTVAIPASDLQSAASITLTAQNPGSPASSSITLTVH